MLERNVTADASAITVRVNDILLEQMAECPGRITDVIFVQGCNLSCKFCFNPILIPEGLGVPMDADFVWSKLSPVSDALAISGGEPLLFKDDVIKLAIKCSEAGKYSMLFTNGVLLDEDTCKLFDEVHVDVKINQRYEKYSNVSFSVVPSDPSAFRGIMDTLALNDIDAESVEVRDTPFKEDFIKFMEDYRESR